MQLFKNLLLTALSLSLCGAVQAQRGEYGKNILSASPMSVTDRGVGFGLGYERSLDNKGIFSLNLPVIYAFNVDDDQYYNYTPGVYDRVEYMLYAYPGVKIYPTGAFGKVRYGVGPSLVIAAGQQYDDRGYYNYPNPYDPNDPWQTWGPRYGSRFMLGTMINNSLNINPTSHLYLGLELGLGVTYLNTFEGRNFGTDPLVQLSFRIGYRF
jgi:hypothetical protein